MRHLVLIFFCKYLLFVLWLFCCEKLREREMFGFDNLYLLSRNTVDGGERVYQIVTYFTNCFYYDFSNCFKKPLPIN